MSAPTKCLACSNGHRYTWPKAYRRHGGRALTEGSLCPHHIPHDPDPAKPRSEWQWGDCGQPLATARLPEGVGELWTSEVSYEGEYDRIEMIEYGVDGEPQMIAVGTHCTVDWCERDDQLYWHDVGGGGVLLQESDFKCRPVWVAAGVTIQAGQYPDYDEISVDEAKAKGWSLLDEPLLLTQYGKETRNPFEVAEGDISTWYCRICDDNFPAENECKHLAWLPWHGIMGTGDGERCELDDEYTKRSVHAIVRKSGMGQQLIDMITMPSQKRRQLLSYTIPKFWDEVWQRLTNDEHQSASQYYDELPDDCQAGMAWLDTLDLDHAPQHTAQTVEWIERCLLDPKTQRYIMATILL